jgi:hypothetical protein
VASGKTLLEKIAKVQGTEEEGTLSVLLASFSL